MACLNTAELTNQEYLRGFRQEAMRLRIPLDASLELTHRCNLGCVHCYLGPQKLHRERRPEEMSTARVRSLIDELVECGCLFLLITGGEPLLRPDFCELYEYAKMKGLVVTVFTNGTLVDDELLETFKALPPRTVEVSLYGASEDTYERVTGIAGSFARCIQGVEGLLGRGISVRLKTVLMTLNLGELEAMYALAKEYDVPFRFDAAIAPRLTGDKSPIYLRVPAEVALEKEFALEGKAQRWRDFHGEHPVPRQAESLYMCGAGMVACHVDPYGGISPCVMTREPGFNIADLTFAVGWNTVIPGIRDRQARKSAKCYGCEKKNLCGYCPSMFALETGEETAPAEYICRFGDVRMQMIENFHEDR